MQGVSTNQREIVVGAVGLAPSSASTQIGNALKPSPGSGSASFKLLPDPDFLPNPTNIDLVGVLSFYGPICRKLYIIHLDHGFSHQYVCTTFT